MIELVFADLKSHVRSKNIINMKQIQEQCLNFFKTVDLCYMHSKISQYLNYLLSSIKKRRNMKIVLNIKYMFK